MLSQLTSKFYETKEATRDVQSTNHKALIIYNKESPGTFTSAKNQLLALLKSTYQLNQSAMSGLLVLKKRLEKNFTKKKVSSEDDRNAILNILKNELQYAFSTKKIQIKNADKSYFNDLSFDKGVCYQGVLSNVILLIGRLNHTFDEAVIHAKEEAVRQIAADFVRNHSLTNGYQGDELHCINALYNYVSRHYHLEKIYDASSEKKVTNEYRERFSKQVKQEITADFIAKLLFIEFESISEDYSTASYERLKTYLPEVVKTCYEALLSGIYSDFDPNTNQSKIPNYNRAMRILIDLCLEKTGYTKGRVCTTTFDENYTFVQTFSDLFLIENVDDAIGKRSIIRAIADEDIELIKRKLPESSLNIFSASLQNLTQKTLLTLLTSSKYISGRHEYLLFWSILYKTERLTQVLKKFIREKIKKTFYLNFIGPTGASTYEVLIENNHIDFLNELLSDLSSEEVQTWINSTKYNRGRTPAYIAAEKGISVLIKSLHNLGANLNIFSENGFTAACVAATNNHGNVFNELYKIDSKLCLEAPSESHIPPIFVAAYRGHAGLVKQLLKLGADKNATDRFGVSIAFIAAYMGNIGVLEVLNQYKADFEIRENEYGDTPAHAAARRNRIESLEKLFEFGFDPTTPNKLGATPEDAAREAGHIATAKKIHQLTKLFKEKSASKLDTQRARFFQSRRSSRDIIRPLSIRRRFSLK